MTSRATPPGMTAVRGLGWDIDSSYSSPRGELFPVGSFGHTGFTGTSLWLDPASGGYVIILASRLHPDGGGDMTPLRARVATIAAAAMTECRRSAPRAGSTPGADASRRAVHRAPPAEAGPGRASTSSPARASRRFEGPKGRAAHQPHRRSIGPARARSTCCTGPRAPGWSRCSAPSTASGALDDDENVASEKDAKTGLTIHSLYGDTRRPTDDMLHGHRHHRRGPADVGARFYTYHATVGYVMEEAAKRKIAVVVLDRPNPINGWQIEGPVPDEPVLGSLVSTTHAHAPRADAWASSRGCFNGERGIGADLTVVPAEGWARDAWFDQTGLSWVNPSPNMRNLNQATLYPGIGAIEYSNISVGRGTDQPFEQLGAPWIDGPRLAEALNARRLPGIRFYPVTFTPTASKYASEACQGVFMVITDRMALQPVRVGLEIAGALGRLFGDAYKLENTERLMGSRESLERVVKGEDPGAVAAAWAAGEASGARRARSTCSTSRGGSRKPRRARRGHETLNRTRDRRATSALRAIVYSRYSIR